MSGQPMNGTSQLSDAREPALLKALLEAAADAIIVTDKAGVITRANSAASRLFGYPADALVGENLLLLVPGGMAAGHPEFIKGHSRTNETRTNGVGRDVEGRRKDGTVFPLRLSVGEAVIEDEPTFVTILHDLGPERSTEEAMMLAQRMDAIGQLTGGISHDFNNLLTVIIGNLELLQAIETSDAAKPLIKDALEAAGLGEELTSRLLVFARKSALRSEPTNLEEILKTSIRLLRRTINPQCRIDFSAAKDAWMAMIDPTQLQTAILNLTLNAQDAMPEGGRIMIEVDNVVVDERYLAQDIEFRKGSFVRLTVSDDGEGMSAAARARAIEPFYTTKPAGKGTGLGLSMVYGFVKQSGGHFAIYSEPGEGTKVSLYFPALDPTGAIAADSAATSSTKVSRGQGQLILIVEDDPRIRRLTETRLISLGYACLSVPNAADAMDILQSRTDIDLVFTDLVMPGEMTGYDLACRISDEFPEIGVLITSGFSEGLLRDGKVGPEFPVLGKPYRNDALAEAIQAGLGGT